MRKILTTAFSIKRRAVPSIGQITSLETMMMMMRSENKVTSDALTQGQIVLKQFKWCHG